MSRNRITQLRVSGLRAIADLTLDLRGLTVLVGDNGTGKSTILEVVFGSTPDAPMPVEYLSEGQLAYLAFLALAELHEGRSLLAFDEPEMHLHPALLTRVVGLLEETAEHAPVIVATHSDRLLDALRDPVASVVLCDLDEQHAVRLRRPNAEKLTEWLEDYRGFGSIRAEGYQPHVFDPGPEEGSDLSVRCV